MSGPRPGPFRRSAWRPLPVAACLVLLALQAGGCAAIPMATLGTLAGVTASAVSTGTDIYQMGKLETAEMAPFERATEAARRAADDLCLADKGSERRKRGGLMLHYADAKGAGLKVLIEPRTATLVRVRIDVGWFGSEPTARLFLARMRAHLPETEPHDVSAKSPPPRPAGLSASAESPPNRQTRTRSTPAAPGRTAPTGTWGSAGSM